MWGPTIPTPPMGYYTTGGYGGVQGSVYYGIYVAMDPGNYYGQIFAYNVTNGNLLWIYNATATYGYESPYGNNYPLMLDAVCDGMVYVYSYEHSPTNPLWRGSYVRCINITDGTEIWKLLCFSWGGPSIADGYLVTCSQYDNLIYCIGMGPSAVTVDAPMTAITAGSSVVLRGTVTDQSPGAKASGPKLGFANGIPAVSDADQEAWMEYVYEQQAMPKNAKGVEVSLDAIDPNNNFIHIGTATSDTSGLFSYMWTTPDVPGTYTVIATFAGSKSYGSSYVETAMAVSEAPPAPAEPQPEPAQPPLDMYLLYATIAIIVAIAIVGLMILRKKP